MAPRRIILFAAVRMEACAVARALGGGRRGGTPEQFGGHPLSLHVIGIRAGRRPAVLPPDAGCLVMAGFGGGLDPSLRVGDVVVDWPGETVPPPAGPFVIGRIHTSANVVATAAEKGAFYQATGALAEDMENAVVRPLAAAAGIPFVGVRAITDRADESLDPALLGLVDDIGRPRPAAVAAYLLRRPGRIGDLRRLSAAATLAGRRLGEAVRAVLESPAFARLVSGDGDTGGG